MNRNIFHCFVYGFVCAILFAKVNVASAQSKLPDIFLDKESAFTIPFDWDSASTSIPIIQISLNGEPLLPFQFDTGDNTSFAVSPWGSEKLHIKPTEPPIPSPKGVGKVWLVDIKRVLIPTISAEGKNLEIFTPKVVLFESPRTFGRFRGSPTAGTFGSQLIPQSVVQLDFAAKVIRIYFGSHKPLQILGAAILPLHTDNKKWAAPVILVQRKC